MLTYVGESLRLDEWLDTLTYNVYNYDQKMGRIRSKYEFDASNGKNIEITLSQQNYTRNQSMIWMDQVI